MKLQDKIIVFFFLLVLRFASGHRKLLVLSISLQAFSKLFAELLLNQVNCLFLSFSETLGNTRVLSLNRALFLSAGASISILFNCMFETRGVITIGWLWIVRIVGCCRGVFLNVLLLHIRTFEWRDYKGTEVKKDGSYLYSEELEAVSHCCNYLSWLSQVSDPTRSSRACDSLQ
ncbi:unnamed protein product [Brassica napus]|uniref:(rape) hypothetical protein n=1 Tax=Brassica napus TaxID=3708 RepID=A0A816J5W0_BRANA|nr:unnamed protein product [Brassica napus]